MAEEPKATLIRERLDVCESDRARMALMNPVLIEHKKNERTIDGIDIVRVRSRYDLAYISYLHIFPSWLFRKSRYHE